MSALARAGSCIFQNALIKEALNDFRTRVYSALRNAPARGYPIRSRTWQYVKEGPDSRDTHRYNALPGRAQRRGDMKSRAEAFACIHAMRSTSHSLVAKVSLSADLLPYETWEKLVEEAHRLWTVYVECVHPEAVNRVATRFINNLQLPKACLTSSSKEEYLTTPPQVPAALPQHVLEISGSGVDQRFTGYEYGSARHPSRNYCKGGAWD